MRINNNLQALNAWRQLTQTDNRLSRSLERLSSGLRINRAADDAAGLAVSEKMRAQIRSIDQAVRNALDGISLLQTAEGALHEDSSIIMRVRELGMQASNDTLTAGDRMHLQKEVNQLVEELDRIAQTTEFNTATLLTGSFVGKTLQIGPNSGANHQLTISFRAMTAAALSMVSSVGGAAISISTQTAAQSAVAKLDAALTRISEERATMGAWQNRLEHTITNLGISSENLTAAESRIRDVDMAAEMVQFTKNQILIQSGMAMMAQANIKPQSVLQLLA